MNRFKFFLWPRFYFTTLNRLSNHIHILNLSEENLPLVSPCRGIMDQIKCTLLVHSTVHHHRELIKRMRNTRHRRSNSCGIVLSRILINLFSLCSSSPSPTIWSFPAAVNGKYTHPQRTVINTSQNSGGPFIFHPSTIIGKGFYSYTTWRWCRAPFLGTFARNPLFTVNQ